MNEERPKKPVRVGVIGTGHFADEHLVPALHEISPKLFWTVLSRDRGRGEAFAHKHGATSPHPVYTDLGAFLADPNLTAVLIPTPDASHAAYAIAAAKAGKHVFVEKPMAPTSAEAAEMVSACRAAGVLLTVGYHNRFHIVHQALKKEMNGRWGKPQHMSVHWTSALMDRQSWNGSNQRWWSLSALGTHALDFVRWCMMPACGEVRSVRGLFGHPRTAVSRDENATMLLSFMSGATAEIHVSISHAPVKRIEVHLEKATIFAEDTLGAKSSGKFLVRPTHQGAEDLPTSCTVNNPYTDELDYFLSCINFLGSTEYSRSLEVTGEEGLRNVEILEQVEADARR